MTASMIVQLLLKFGPGAIDVIKDLIAVWHKPELTVEEVNKICDDRIKKSYDDYIKEAAEKSDS